MMWKWSELKNILRKNDEITQSACIMWPVVWASTATGPEEPHVTVIYLGDKDLLVKEDILAAMREVSNIPVAVLASVTGVEWFGPNADIPVLTMEHTYLHRYRTMVESALSKRGIENASEYKEYKPHMTVPAEVAVDKTYNNTYVLTQPELWWGDEHIRT